jgi:hypothetical protein
MKRFKNRTILMIFLLGAGRSIQSKQLSDDFIDVMVDFAYPVSMMQSVRQDLNQAVYFLQQQDLQQVVSHLEQAASKSAIRLNVSQDDKDYIQAMIDQINALIASLESEQDRSHIAQLSQEVQDHLV